MGMTRLFPVFLFCALLCSGQSKTPTASTYKPSPGEWPTYNRDLAGTRYSPLTQINTSNVSQLKLAWSYNPSDSGARPSPEVTPLFIGGRCYFSSSPLPPTPCH